MNILIFILGLLLLVLNIGAIATVLLEDILYSKKEKTIKLLFILLVPFIGAIRELYLLRKFHKSYRSSTEDTNGVSGYSSSDFSSGGGGD